MVVPDDVVAIAKGVKALSDEFEVVLSAGGIGPTVDDITVAGIARAYGLNVTRYVDR
jgi:molybdopterin-biosynthesis enzyme MoeA-like protein